MKHSLRRTAILSLVSLLLLLSLSLSACRNKSFTPIAPPSDPENGDALPADFQCWVRTEGGSEYALTPAVAAEVYSAVKKVYEKSDPAAPVPTGNAGLRLVFCTGGTAPETSIPAYQLPNATLYGVYTLFPDDTGWYGDNVITAHVNVFALKNGSYERIAEMVGAGEN